MNPYRTPSPPLPPLPESLWSRVVRVAAEHGPAALAAIAIVLSFLGVGLLFVAGVRERDEAYATQCESACALLDAEVRDAERGRCVCVGRTRLVHFDSDWRPTEVRLSEEP